MISLILIFGFFHITSVSDFSAFDAGIFSPEANALSVSMFVET